MIQYLIDHTESFDPETIHILSDALDVAWQRLLANTHHLGGPGEAERTALAKHIVDIARNGERDHRRLVNRALVRFSLPPFAEPSSATCSFYEILGKKWSGHPRGRDISRRK
jgi:hypothetical protein